MQKLPQLTFRDLFSLVALVAMGCGWWVEYRNATKLANELKRAADELVEVKAANKDTWDALGRYVDAAMLAGYEFKFEGDNVSLKAIK
jgi:hypothetical protein